MRRSPSRPNCLREIVVRGHDQTAPDPGCLADRCADRDARRAAFDSPRDETGVVTDRDDATGANSVPRRLGAGPMSSAR